MKIGFIGAGNMGSAIIKGLIRSESLSEVEINIFDVDAKKSEELSKEYDVNSLQNEIEVSDISDILILSVKPNIYNSILEKIKYRIGESKIIVTIAAGINIEHI